jgi:glycosyltransferase involved in cell wall biosynthesis
VPEIQVVVPVHNGADQLDHILEVLLAQRLPQQWRSRIYVVDDGSTDGTSVVARGFAKAGIHLLVNPSPLGRACTRNRGAARSDSRLLAFIDVDCVPVDERWLERHIAALEAGADLTGGPIEPSGGGFWAAYMVEVAARRDLAAGAGDFQALTSANLAFRRDCWNLLRGFDERYRQYGFEDRDLLARAVELGVRIVFVPEAAVATPPPRTVAELVRKNEVAGRYSAPLFRERHPAIYRRTPFRMFDAQVGPLAGLQVAGPLGSLARPVAAFAERLTNVAWLPRRFRLGVVRLALGLAFFRGTSLPGD